MVVVVRGGGWVWCGWWWWWWWWWVKKEEIRNRRRFGSSVGRGEKYKGIAVVQLVAHHRCLVAKDGCVVGQRSGKRYRYEK